MSQTVTILSLHKWKDKISGSRRTEEQCRELLQSLREAIAATEKAVPRGELGPHPLQREPRPKLQNPGGEFRECHWEEALWRKYHIEASVDGVWSRVLSYQVMLRESNRIDAGWGEIDLLAVSEDGSPVIVELKSEQSSETPLRMLVEGLANAVAVRKCWDVFGTKFNSIVAAMGLPCCDPPRTFRVVCLAPDYYWQECFRKKSLPSRCLEQLTNAASQEGFPIEFARIHHQGNDQVGLPNVSGVSRLSLSSMECKRDPNRVDNSGRAYAGSQRQIQTYVNDSPKTLNKAIVDSFGTSFPTSARIRWVSPLKNDAYTEYRDSDFLRALGLQKHEGKLSAFWPRGGPCWDALARIETEGKLVGWILVEAKSHINEIYGGGCCAGGSSLLQIETALDQTKRWLGVGSSADWLGSLYQSANRYAHLYFLREIAGLDAFLVNLYFINDSHSPTTAQQWRPEISEVQRKLGLDRPVPFSAEVFLDALD